MQKNNKSLTPIDSMHIPNVSHQENVLWDLLYTEQYFIVYFLLLWFHNYVILIFVTDEF